MSKARIRRADIPAKAPQVFIWGACESCGVTAVLESHTAAHVSRQLCATCAESTDLHGRRAATGKRFSPRVRAQR